MSSSVDFTSFLKLMTHKKASDLFITAGVPPSMKVHGRIAPITQNALTPQQSRDMVLNVMTPSQREEFEKTHECQFAISVTGVGRFRVSCFYQRNCVGMVLRRIETRIPTIEELNLPAIIKSLAMTKRGIIMFVGATGTGKSTSLAAMIGYRNQNSTGHIITIEDPIEYVHKHEGCIITQRELGIDTDTWENALKNTLRQAPDVIMIGEVRTRETMEHAVNFSETGHLCLCTLHANNANQAMDRIIHFFSEDRRSQLFMDLSLNLKGVVAQQLIPTPDGKARRVAMEVMLGTPLVAGLHPPGRDPQAQGRDEGIDQPRHAARSTRACSSSIRLARSATRTRCVTPTRANEVRLQDQARAGRRCAHVVAGPGWRGIGGDEGLAELRWWSAATLTLVATRLAEEGARWAPSSFQLPPDTAYQRLLGGVAERKATGIDALYALHLAGYLRHFGFLRCAVRRARHHHHAVGGGDGNIRAANALGRRQLGLHLGRDPGIGRFVGHGLVVRLLLHGSVLCGDLRERHDREGGYQASGNKRLANHVVGAHGESPVVGKRCP